MTASHARMRAFSAAAICLAISLAGASKAQAARLGDRPLKPGMSGGDVRQLQKGLTRLKSRTPADGRFGKATFRNVKAVERRMRWLVDGRVDRRQGKRIRNQVQKQRLRKLARARDAAGGYVFPVNGPHDFGGSAARFGTARSGHSHQGQDVFAPCGTPMRAASDGYVKAKAYQAGGAGYYLVAHGTDGTDTVYMHMKKASWAPEGRKLFAGQQIGRVGDSGNASGCHLHFEYWTAPGWYSGGHPIDPLPGLQAWDAYS